MGVPSGRPLSKIAWPMAALALALCWAPFGCSQEKRLPEGWKAQESSIGRVRLIDPKGKEVWYTFPDRASAISYAHYSERVDRERANETWGPAK